MRGACAHEPGGRVTARRRLALQARADRQSGRDRAARCAHRAGARAGSGGGSPRGRRIGAWRTLRPTGRSRSPGQLRSPPISTARRSLPRPARAAPEPSIPVTAFCPRTPVSRVRWRTQALFLSDRGADAIELMGDKVRARNFVAARGFPVAPSAIEDDDPVTFTERARAIGFPLSDQACGRRRREGNAHRARGAGAGGRDRACPQRGRPLFWRRPALRRAIHRAAAPHRGAGAGRRARQRAFICSSASARYSGAFRRSSRKRLLRPLTANSAVASAKPLSASPARPVTAMPVRSNSSTEAASSISSK